jgi:hypothetical protein
MFDLVLMEDLGRMMRDVDAVKLCEFCKDHDTRLIAINDHVDTAQDNWEDMANRVDSWLPRKPGVNVLQPAKLIA